MKKLRCDVCGYLHNGDHAPEICPKCSVPKEKFILLDEEETEMMEDAVETKSKYVQILAHLDGILSLAQEGIDLNLDDGCNKIFQKAKEEISGIHKMIKDELAGHAQQCVWVKVVNDGELL